MMKSLGKRPEGARLERMEASPLWRAAQFRNVHPVIPGLRDPGARCRRSREFLCGGERRVPRGPLPSIESARGVGQARRRPVCARPGSATRRC